MAAAQCPGRADVMRSIAGSGRARPACRQLNLLRRGHSLVTGAVKLAEGSALRLAQAAWPVAAPRAPLADTPPTSSPPKLAPAPSVQERAEGRYVIKAIKTATSWQELEALASTHARVFNHIHVSALVARLPKLVHPSQLEQPEKGRFNRFLGRISDLVSQRLPTFDARAVSNVLWAVSKLGFSPAPPLLNKFLFEAYVRMHEFNAQELANLCWALATLAAMGNTPVRTWLAKFTQAAVQRVPALKPQELAHMAWALSELYPEEAACGPRPRPHNRRALRGRAQAGAGPIRAPGDMLPHLVTALASQAVASLEGFQCGELVMALRALHRLRPAAGLRLLRPALPHLLRRPGLLSPQDLANLWMVAGKVGASRNAEELKLPAALVAARAAEEAQARQAEAATAAPAGAAAAGAPVAFSRPPAAPAAATTTPISSSSSSRASTAPAPAEAAPAAAAAAGTPAGAGAPEHAGRRHLYHLLDVTLRSLYACSPEGLCVMLVAWARLDLRIPPVLADAVFARYGRVTRAGITFQGASATLWAAARLRLRPPAPLMGMLLTCAALQMPLARPCDLVALMWALSKLGFMPSKPLLQRVSARLGEVGDQLQPSGVHVFLTAYAMFGAPPPPAVRAAAMRIARRQLARCAAALTVRPEAPAAAATTPGAAGAGAAPAVPSRQAGTNPWQQRVEAVRSAARLMPPHLAVRFFATLLDVGVRKPSTTRGAFTSTLALERLQVKLASPRKRRALTFTLAVATSGRMEQLSNSALCALVTTLTRLRLAPSAAYLTELVQTALQRLDTMTAWQASGLLVGLAKLHAWAGSRPPSEWVARVLRFLEPQYGALKDQQLVSVLHGLACMRFRPPASWLQRYFGACMDRLTTMHAPSLQLLLRDLAVMQLQLPEQSLACRLLNLAVRRKQLSEKDAGMVRPRLRLRLPRQDMRLSLCRVCVGLNGCPV